MSEIAPQTDNGNIYVTNRLLAVGRDRETRFWEEEYSGSLKGVIISE